MKNKSPRIFFGPCWYGKTAPILASALREIGVKATWVFEGELPAIYTDAKYDVFMDFRDLKNKYHRFLKRLCYSLKFFLQHDVFIFMFGGSLLPHNLDLPILKLFHKKTIMYFVGGDIRHYESYVAAAKKVGFKYYRSKEGRDMGPDALKRRLRMIHRVERYVDYIITLPSISQLLTKKYYMMYLPMDIDNIRYNNVPNPRPIVVHAPLNPEFKGTSYIVEAVERLKREGYDFEFCLFKNTPNTKVREILSEADIAVDQLFNCISVTFGTEAMAAGCAVLGGNFPEFSGFPRELPIIDTHPDNIYQNLKMLLENPKLRQELGEKGRKYVEKYHDARKIANQILQLLAGNTENLISYNSQDS